MWFYITARDMTIFKPDGKVLSFWLYADNEDHLRKLLKEKGFTDIESIKQTKGPLEYE